jgi:hypothetical protein
MNWADVDLHPDRRKLRQFAALLFVIALLFAIFSKPIWAAVAAYALLSVVVPRLAYPVYFVLTVVTFPIGWIVARVMLAIIFYVVITPIALVQRLLRRDALRLRRSDAASYWENVEGKRDPASYLRQF